MLTIKEEKLRGVNTMNKNLRKPIEEMSEEELKEILKIAFKKTYILGIADEEEFNEVSEKIVERVGNEKYSDMLSQVAEEVKREGY